jgi:hypothetical protein
VNISNVFSESASMKSIDQRVGGFFVIQEEPGKPLKSTQEFHPLTSPLAVENTTNTEQALTLSRSSTRWASLTLPGSKT